MKWITRARPKTDRIGSPWLSTRFIDPDAEIIYVPADAVLDYARHVGGRSFDAPGADYTHQANLAGSERCTFETLIAEFHLDGDPAQTRLAPSCTPPTCTPTHSAEGPLPNGARRTRRGSRRPDAAQPRNVRLRRALRLVPAAGHGHHRMSTADRDADRALRRDAVRQVAALMAAAAITAPKSGGQLMLAGKPEFLETVVVEDPAQRRRLAGWLRARGKERRESIWFRDAEAAEAVDAILLIGLAPNWYPPNYDCGACGYSTCAEFMHASKELRAESDELEFTGPTCNLRDIDLGIAVGSAARTAAINAIDCRCQTRVATAARKLGLITAEVAVALSLSVTHKAIGFDRRMPDIDFDTLDLSATGTLPIAKANTSGRAKPRAQQQPRHSISRHTRAAEPQ